MCRLRSLSRLYARAKLKTRVHPRSRAYNYLNPVNIPTDKRAACVDGVRKRIEGKEGMNVGQLANRETGQDRGRGHFALASAEHYTRNVHLLIIHSSGLNLFFFAGYTETYLRKSYLELRIAKL